ncbi:transcription antitermination factor NusB [Candidatus Clavichlamydia salmonicola]|uniref:transcription antitermination factor NusB n=1 Tax=Candidatus Clavichlamydia salmonicola TaxID=469812 RepID=UPI0018917876|nr:transcription antitermination factor NusB [Candidatus Clavichlamydia salmonicola]
MNLSSQKIREIILQTLFCFEVNDTEKEHLIPLLVKDLMVSRKIALLAFEEALLIWNNREQLDIIISNTVKNYELHQIPYLEKNILRLCIHQLMNKEIITPFKIIMSEGTRLALKFIASEASLFIAAVLTTYNQTIAENSTIQPINFDESSPT